MKRPLKRTVSGLLIAALLTLTLAMGLTSCSDGVRLKGMKEPERAVEFMDVLNKNMEKQSSYVAEMEASMTMEMYRMEISMTATGTQTICGQGTDDYFTHSETRQIMSMNGDETEITTIEGFADEKMFYYHAEDGLRTTKLWSTLSSADYVAFDNTYSLATDMNDDVMATEATTRTCVQNDDKTWTATYTNYTADGLKAFGSIMSGLDSLLEVEDVRVADVVMTVNASEDLLPTTMEMAFVFAPADEADDDVELPVMTAKTTYKDIGTAEAFEVDLGGYYEVADLRVATVVEKSLQDFLNADKAEFEVVTSQNIKYQGQNSKTTETDTGTFGVDENGYTFDIDAKVGIVRYDITYEDGIYLMMQGDDKKTKQYWTEVEARAYIRDLLDPAAFSISRVRSIEKDEEASEDGKTVYLITVKTPDLTEYESALGGVNLSGVTTMKVTIEDGRMTEQYYELSMASGNQYKFVVTATCTYISFTEDVDNETN